MRSLVSTVLIAVSLVAAVDSVAIAQAPEKTHSIVINAHGAKALVKDEALGGLVDAGYVVADETPSTIRTQRRAFENVWHLEISLNVLSVDSATTRIIVTGNYTVDVLHPEPQAAVESDSGISGKMWKQMQVAADKIREAVHSPSR